MTRGHAGRGVGVCIAPPEPACLSLPGGAPAVAAPCTLRIDGSFSVTSTSNAVHEHFAQRAWGPACPGASLCRANGRMASVRLEVDDDDALTVTPFNPFNVTQSCCDHESVSALRLTLGKEQLDTTGLTALSQIDFGVRDNGDVPNLPHGGGYALALAQQATRVGGVYSLPGALPVVSPNGLYAFAFNSTAATGIALPVLEMRADKTSDCARAGASPTGRLTVTGSSVQTGGGGGRPPSLSARLTDDIGGLGRTA
ncbi:MAG: hypothetical protein C0505_15110 [Leptothrix sp. (in: Bacteria)]|nr:hypothetical protein [Leptothrix sp. (in: b-proteobacteria)]